MVHRMAPREIIQLHRYQEWSFSFALAWINCFCRRICFCNILNPSSSEYAPPPCSCPSSLYNSPSESPVLLSGQGGGTEDFLAGGIGALLLRAAWLASAASCACWAAEGRPDTLWLLLYMAFAFCCGVHPPEFSWIFSGFERWCCPP